MKKTEKLTTRALTEGYSPVVGAQRQANLPFTKDAWRQMKNIQTGKFISLILRHSPETIGIKLDENGWANVSELISGINTKGHKIDMTMLEEIVATNDKKRYSFNSDKTKIRANQGHSVNVDIELKPVIPPDVLYHGTAKHFCENIISNGLKKQGRNHVHLSADKETAVNVGKRHGNPVVLSINAGEMHNAGYIFYFSENEVWLTNNVPPELWQSLKKCQ